MVARIKKVNTLKGFHKATTLSKKGILRKKLEVRKVTSLRGRVSFAEAPLVTLPQTPQTALLDSTVIDSFEYSIKKRILEISFVRGGVWEYYGVPEQVVYELANAPSKGRYFYYNIRTSFNYRRIK